MTISETEFGEKVVTLLEGLNELDNHRAAQIRALQSEVEALRRGMAAMTEVMVTNADLDDYALRSELGDLLAQLAEATATPFNPPEAHRD